jgi:hypothetical protein
MCPAEGGTRSKNLKPAYSCTATYDVVGFAVEFRVKNALVINTGLHMVKTKVNTF